MNKKQIKKNYKAQKRKLRNEYKNAIANHRKEYRTRLSEVKESLECDIAEYYLISGKKPPTDPPKRSLLEEIGNAVTHGVGSIFSIVALVLMLLAADRTVETVSALIYFVGMLMMFTMSCLYHAFAHGSAVKRLFRRFDYTGIYLLIGATFSPPLLSFIGGAFGTWFSVIQWSVIAVGITLIGVFGPTRFRFVHIPLYVALGWSAILLLPTLIRGSLPLAMWILAGGIVYTLGLIPFMMKSKVAHFVWHFFVLAGAVVQWIGIYTYIYLA